MMQLLPWIFGGMVALGLLLRTSGAHARLLGPDYEAGVDALARMLLAETGLEHAEKEMAQIVFVALNRARDWGVPVTQVVNPTGYRQGEAWSTGATYEAIFNRAHTRGDWQAAKAFVRRVLGGAFSNMGFLRFVHPANMPEPPCVSNRVEADTVAGRRCIPTWVVQGTVVGRGMFA